MKLLQKLDEIKRHKDSENQYWSLSTQVKKNETFEELSAAFLEAVEFVQAINEKCKFEGRTYIQADEFLKRIGAESEG